MNGRRPLIAALAGVAALSLAADDLLDLRRRI